MERPRERIETMYEYKNALDVLRLCASVSLDAPDGDVRRAYEAVERALTRIETALAEYDQTYDIYAGGDDYRFIERVRGLIRQLREPIPEPCLDCAYCFDDPTPQCILLGETFPYATCEDYD
jgi:hypothetical protein